jgi:hypothetical protein
MPMAWNGLFDERGKTGPVGSPMLSTTSPEAESTITEP